MRIRQNQLIGGDHAMARTLNVLMDRQWAGFKPALAYLILDEEGPILVDDSGDARPDPPILRYRADGVFAHP